MCSEKDTFEGPLIALNVFLKQWKRVKQIVVGRNAISIDSHFYSVSWENVIPQK